MNLAGWRGLLGRSVPNSVLRRLLEIQFLSADKSSKTVQQLREANDVQVRQVADAAGAAYQWDEASRTHVVNVENWQNLKVSLASGHFQRVKLADPQSNASVETWSITSPEFTIPGNLAQLGGLGSLWQVFPGAIEPVNDSQDFVGPVDVVYTWVDSEDPVWQATYKESLAGIVGDIEASSIDMARFISRDELKYSLRSLEMNMPWVNKIYLVTAGQKPQWLVADHPKLVLVDHEDIFEDADQCLPTFNSHAIEARLSFIPGLSEQFIYVNDDVFFGRPLHPNVFFGPAGQSKSSMSASHFANAENPELPVNAAAANNRELMVSNFGRTTSRKFKHAAHPQRLSVHQKVYELCGDVLDETARHKFRDPTDISLPSSLAHQVAAQTGLGYSVDIDYTYLDIGADDFFLQAMRLVQRRKPQMFCINEVMQTTDALERSKIVAQVLQTLYPLPSSFEK